MISERLGQVKTAINLFFDEKSQKSSLQQPPLILTWTPSRPHIYAKNQENKVSYPNFRRRIHF